MKKTLFLLCFCHIINLPIYAQNLCSVDSVSILAGLENRLLEAKLPPKVANELIIQIDTKQHIDSITQQIFLFVCNENPIFDYNHIKNKGFTIENIAPKLGFYLLHFKNKALARLFMTHSTAHAQVINTQYNHYVQARNIPNDTDYELQWDLKKIEANTAWTQTTGGTNALGDTIVVAILDGGYQTTHEDLQKNIWYNKNEIPSNGIDDDNNGYIDDVRGWDFAHNDDNVSRYTTHGTQVASIIGADGNNGKGVTGVNQHIKMLLLANIETMANVLRAYNYVLEMRRKYERTNRREGAYIVATNASFGINNAKSSDFPLWCAMYDTLGKAGILSVAATSNDGQANTDIQPDMPTDCGSEYLIMVTNTDFNDRLKGAFGKQKVDLAAPGEGSYTVYPDSNSDNTYATFGGTSAATPHVTGAIALLYAMPNAIFAQNQREKPVETASLLKSALLRGTDKLPILNDKTTSGGRLNIGYSMELLQKWYTPDQTNALLEIYPNPFQENLNLVFLSKKTPIEITVFDALGHLILQQNITIPTPSNGVFLLKTDTWNLGFYIIQSRFDDGTYQVKKIIKNAT